MMTKKKLIVCLPKFIIETQDQSNWVIQKSRIIDDTQTNVKHTRSIYDKRSMKITLIFFLRAQSE